MVVPPPPPELPAGGTVPPPPAWRPFIQNTHCFQFLCQQVAGGVRVQLIVRLRIIAPLSSLKARILPPFPSSIYSGFIPLILSIACANKTFVALSGNPGLNFNPAVAVCNAPSIRTPNNSVWNFFSASSYLLLRSLNCVVTAVKSAFAWFLTPLPFPHRSHRRQLPFPNVPFLSSDCRFGL